MRNISFLDNNWCFENFYSGECWRRISLVTIYLKQSRLYNKFWCLTLCFWSRCSACCFDYPVIIWNTTERCLNGIPDVGSVLRNWLLWRICSVHLHLWHSHYWWTVYGLMNVIPTNLIWHDVTMTNQLLLCY